MPNILVVHYVTGLAEIIADVLKGKGYSAACMKVSGDDLGKVAQQVVDRNPDLVFLSLNFGKGYLRKDKEAKPTWLRREEGLAELVNIRHRSGVPVVIVSSSSNGPRIEALRNGAIRYYEMNSSTYLVDLPRIVAEVIGTPQS